MGNEFQLREVQVGRLATTVSIREVAGDAPPLLMLHGVGLEHQRWGRTRELLGRSTIAFDVRTEHLGRRPSMRTFAKFTAKLLRELDLPLVDVMGLSWGGMAAQQLVHDHSAQFRRMVLVSTSPGYMGVPTRPSTTKILMSPKRSEDRLPELVRKLYSGDFVDNPALARELGLIRTIDEGAYRRQLRSLIGWTSSPWLPLVQKKTLILHADNDPVFPYPNAALLRLLIRGATLKKVPGGGHLFVLTRPEGSAQIIDDFLDGYDLAKRPGPAAGPDEAGTAESRMRGT